MSIEKLRFIARRSIHILVKFCELPSKVSFVTLGRTDFLLMVLARSS